MAVKDESGPDPAVYMTISPLRRADLAIKNPAGGFSCRESILPPGRRMPVLPGDLDSTGRSAVMALTARSAPEPRWCRTSALGQIEKSAWKLRMSDVGYRPDI